MKLLRRKSATINVRILIFEIPHLYKYSGVEKCAEKEKRVCMTIPQQECKEKKIPKCRLVAQEECKLVPHEKCVEENVTTAEQCRLNTRLACTDKPRQKCGQTVR